VSASAILAPRITLRNALVGDVDTMSRMINGYAAVGLMLPRTPSELLGRLHEFMVATEADGAVAACGGLKRRGSRRAEIVSLAVREDLRGQGLGGRVLDRLVQEAERLGVDSVVATTRRERFFRIRGFRPADQDWVCRRMVVGSVGGKVVVERRLDGSRGTSTGVGETWSVPSTWSDDRPSLALVDKIREKCMIIRSAGRVQPAPSLR
jgi:amino-acid N-acetyltransferase